MTLSNCFWKPTNCSWSVSDHPPENKKISHTCSCPFELIDIPVITTPGAGIIVSIYIKINATNGLNICKSSVNPITSLRFSTSFNSLAFTGLSTTLCTTLTGSGTKYLVICLRLSFRITWGRLNESESFRLDHTRTWVSCHLFASH